MSGKMAKIHFSLKILRHFPVQEGPMVVSNWFLVVLFLSEGPVAKLGQD